MSRHDYTKHSKKNQNEVEELETVTEEIEQVEEFVETMVEAEPTNDAEEYELGIVTGCAKLRVRSEPRFGSNVICEIEQGTRVMIDTAKSTFDYYKIYTESGVEGFCSKTYIVR